MAWIVQFNIQAMGGELEIIARFPDGEFKIADFSSTEEFKLKN